MIIRGILDTALAGNFVCLRGYATLGELNKISKADPGYQRDLIKSHRQKMIDFLDDAEYLFFPEVILGACLNETNLYEVTDSFYKELQDGKGHNYQFTYFHLKYTVSKAKSRGDTRSVEYTRLAELFHEFSRTFPKFHRIDGNHRLSILDPDQKLDEHLKKRFENHNVPFCIIFFRNNDELNKYSRALFHNLNYNQIPITKEKNLQLILDEGSPFSDKDLERFGKAYPLARKILKTWDLDIVPHLKKVLMPGKSTETVYRTYLINILEILIDKKVTKPEKKLKDVLAEINTLYSDKRLQDHDNHGLLTTFTYYGSISPSKLKIFGNWVLENHIYNTKDIKAEELIKVFDRVLESRNRTIFVSMQFDDATDENYKAIQHAVDDINKENSDFNLRIKEIRIDKVKKGHSYKITEEILEFIEGCGYLIADLSFGNKNVYHEIGYLMGLNKNGGMKQDNFLLIFNKALKDTDFNKDVGFNLKAHQVLIAKGTDDLREALKEQIRIYYNLKISKAYV